MTAEEKTQEQTRRLLSTTDAAVWTDIWLEIIAEKPSIPTDWGTMVGWFANAIGTGEIIGREKGRYEASEAGLVSLDREQLLMAFGYFALVPFRSDEDCAPKATAITSCVAALVEGMTFEDWLERYRRGENE